MELGGTSGRARTAVRYQRGCSYLAASAAASSAALAAPLGQAGGRPAAAAWEDRCPSGWAADLGEVLRGVRPQVAWPPEQAWPPFCQVLFASDQIVAFDCLSMSMRG